MVGKNPYDKILDDGGKHIPYGRDLAIALGYSEDDLRWLPAEAVDSFRGVGNPFAVCEIEAGQDVLVISGGDMDAVLASIAVGAKGRVVAGCLAANQLESIDGMRLAGGFHNLFPQRIFPEEMSLPDHSFDVVIYNGVFTILEDIDLVQSEIARVLRSGGRLGESTLVTRTPIYDKWYDLLGTVDDANDEYPAYMFGMTTNEIFRQLVEKTGLVVENYVVNAEYHFLSEGGLLATELVGIHSVSLSAVKP